MSDLIDIVERMRNVAGFDGIPLCHEAAAEITRLRAALAAQVPQWRSIDARHEVSDLGVIRDLGGRILGQWKSDQGYMLVRLSSPRRVERVHRLVAKAFLDNPRGLDTVNHIDCNRANNTATNLEWCTQAENLAHSDSLGRMQRDYWTGKRSPNARLSDDEVRAIRAEYAAGETSHLALARKYQISKRCIGRVIKREVYSYVQ